MEDSTFGDIHCQLAPACAICCCCRLLCYVEPCLSPRKSLIQSIKRRLYEADDDQAVIVMVRLDEASQTPLQSLSNPALATRSMGRLAGSTQGGKAIRREKITLWSTQLGGDVYDVVRLVTIIAREMCKTFEHQ
ncbi:hypothetical protein BASA50_009136 [Batrachochytrium salamandrivorans]|uniref:ADF-H domain-containing protein n=1 Tax=Batrachochytrium salamandrivorans TaxID=1357716 RepID=A0ABQ8F5U8_9FUNG|nr:hypothetical protein BASA50_009136 [Batrachochytrium salamandrivorans]KAH9268655.1 hypothetical protein BASA84_000083 [Batrachochytrium salamandrivorans]